MPKLYTVKALAELFDKKEDTIREWICERLAMINHEKLNRFFMEKARSERELHELFKKRHRERVRMCLRDEKIRLWEALKYGDAGITNRIHQVVEAEKEWLQTFKTSHELDWMKSWEDAGGWR